MSGTAPPRSHRILFLLHCVPSQTATHGGGQLIAQLLQHLSARHRLAVIHVRRPAEPAMDPDLWQACDLVEEVPWVGHPPSLLGRVRQRLSIEAAPLFGLPRWAAHLPGRAFAQRVRSVTHGWRPELIQLEFSVMGRFLAALADCPAPRILTYHMPGTDAVAGGADGRPWWVRAGDRLDRLAWCRFERRVLDQVDAVVTLTDEDRRTLQEAGHRTPVYTIPYGMTVPPTAANPLGEAPPSILFVGNFGHPPNLDAAERLADNILPLVHQECADAVLYLVGDRPPARLIARAGPRVVVTGRVGSVMPYLERAAVVTAPVRIGGGMRVKVLEALGAGKAVVASPLAMHGLSVRAGQEIMVADSDAEFAGCITALLRDPRSRHALAGRARLWAEEALRWERSLERLEHLYAAVLQGSGRMGMDPTEHR
jgi:polysaccharide biosynthesis protein PslH